jgi:helix-turn-helix protein
MNSHSLRGLLKNHRCEIPISRFIRSVPVTEFSVKCERSRMPKAMFTFTEEARDSGSPVMTVTDVAALLQKPVSAIREMCKSRAQRGVHPLPFTKLGKSLRFNRVKVMRWLETMPEKRRPRRKRS